MLITLRQLKTIWGEPFNSNGSDLNVPLGTVSTDSRYLTKGSFFIPLVGEHFDGHFFINEAFHKGAQATIVSETFNLPIPENFIYWRVKDTLKAFQELSRLHRDTLSSYVVAVTGSVGKTTTRALIHSALCPLGRIMSTSENNNNDVGVPITLLNADTTHVAIVVEMGMRGLGEIERLSKCASPNIAIITNIGHSHISLLGSRKNIALAKSEITSFLKPDGVLIIPAGDPMLESILKSRWHGRIIRVDLKVNRDGVQEEMNNNADFQGILNMKDWSILFRGFNFQLPLEGIHNAKNFMFALAVAIELKVPLEKITNLHVELPSGRSQLLSIGGINVMDQTYNSSPESAKAAIDFLKTKPGRRFAVLGTMLELGVNSVVLHKEVAEYVVMNGLDGLVILDNGDEGQAMFTVAKSMPYVEVVSSPEQAYYVLKSWLISGDYLLLKASRKVALERLLPLLKQHY